MTHWPNNVSIHPVSVSCGSSLIRDMSLPRFTKQRETLDGCGDPSALVADAFTAVTTMSTCAGCTHATSLCQLHFVKWHLWQHLHVKILLLNKAWSLKHCSEPLKKGREATCDSTERVWLPEGLVPFYFSSWVSHLPLTSHSPRWPKNCQSLSLSLCQTHTSWYFYLCEDIHAHDALLLTLMLTSQLNL